MAESLDPNVADELEANGIDYYETEPGNWGISMPGLWLRDEAAYPRARKLLEDYQAQRAREASTDRGAGEIQAERVASHTRERGAAV